MDLDDIFKQLLSMSEFKRELFDIGILVGIFYHLQELDCSCNCSFVIRENDNEFLLNSSAF